MATTKTPNQYASGAETFSDNLVGFQVVDGVSQMTNTSFNIDRVIPEKDSKTFQTQPFSDFLTLDTIQQEESQQDTTNTTTSTSTKTSDKIKFYDAKDDGSKSLFGSLSRRLNVAVNNIITKFPAALYVDIESPIKNTNLSAESIVYDLKTKQTTFQIQNSIIFNPFEILLIEPKSNTKLTTTNTIRNFYSSYTKYVIEISGQTYNIVNYTEIDDANKITLQVDGDCFSGQTGYSQSYLIRPNNGIVEEFYSNLDELEIILMNRETIPMYQAPFKVPRDLNGGSSTELVTEIVTWPTTKDGWNPQIMGIDFDYYLESLVSIGQDIDTYKSNLIVRFLTAPQLFEFDTPENKAEAIFQIYGQSFDQVKKFIDNIAYMRNVTYDKINNVPDLLLKNLATTLGLSTIGLFDEKSLQDSLYTRTDTQYIGLNIGKNLVESEYEFYRRILVNLAQLFKSKGTRMAIEFFLKFIGAPEPIIRFDEYIYKVDGPLPKSTFEDDIRSAIQGNYVSYTAVYSGNTYVVTGTTGSTTLTRDEYPVDPDTGLPRGAQSSDGSIFFELGAGWYRKTIDHRSHDILDTDNSILTGRTKTIKTMSKPFTYGEDYFDYYRLLPGLDYGFDLTSEIDNSKTEIINTEAESKYILNRKNINVFLSSDRAIDFDIYTKSRNLLLTFGTMSPLTGMTFAEFLSDSISDIIKNSNTIKYKRYYQSLDDVYNDYKNNTGFTPYNYIKVNEFIERMSPYWTQIIDQFVPATTLWLGGNLIENGTYNRSKFWYRKPCVPIELAETLYPDFNAVIEEDLETILGGGTTKGVDTAEASLRGLFTLSGLTYVLYIEVNGHIFSGTTDPIITDLFSGFTPAADCTSLSSSTYSIPLICEYKDLINPNIAGIKELWIGGIIDLVNQINSQVNETGVSIQVIFYTDENGIEKVKFILMNEECKEGENIDFYFEPVYTAPKRTCDLRVEIWTPDVKYTGDIDACKLKSDVFITVIDDNYDGHGGFVTGIENGNPLNLPVNIYVTSGSTCSGTTQCWDCASGNTWYPYNDSTCYAVTTTGATAPVSPFSLVSVTNTSNSSFGTRIFDNVYYNGGTVGGTVDAYLTTSGLWKYSGGTTTDNGPLNRCGLWTTASNPAPPMNKWLGFGVCLSGLTATKTYYVGIAADNHYRLTLDGIEILNTSGDTGNATYRFKWWNIYPIEIGNGDHTLEVYGLNLEQYASFGCEIYDATFNELTGATTYNDIASKVIFTTSGQTQASVVQNENGTYTSSGYTCPNGYTYSPCSGLCVETIFCESSSITGTSAGICTNCSFEELDITPIETTASGCTFLISGMTETDIYDIIISDAANCEQKLRLEGLEPKIENINGTSGYTIYPKVQYKTTHNFGLKKGTVVYKEINYVPLIVWEDLDNAISNGDYVEIAIENVEIGDVLLSITPKEPSQIPISQLQYAYQNNDSFDFTFDYNRITVTNVECLSSIKRSIINDEFVVLPTTKVYVYSSMNENLDKVPRHFTYKYPEDLFIKSASQPDPCCEYPSGYYEESDYLVDQYGFLVEVTSVNLNYCDGGIYYQIDYSSNSIQSILPCIGFYYNWYVINDSRNITSSDNWRVPTYDDLNTLITFGGTNCGGKLKEIGNEYWIEPNVGATNEYKFNARGVGSRQTDDSTVFTNFKSEFTFWLNYVDNGFYYASHIIYYTGDLTLYNSHSQVTGLPLRLVKNSTTLIHGETGTYVGNNGKTYSTICIGGQEWLSENLVETLYRDLSPIPEVTDGTIWGGLTTGALCAFNNDWTYGCEPSSSTISTTTDENLILFNGPSTGTTRIIVSYMYQHFECLDIKTQQYFINSICTEIPTVEELERTPCDNPDCLYTSCYFDAEFNNYNTMECLSDIEIIGIYDTTEVDSIGTHECDTAKFIVTANETIIGTINLNNTGVDDYFNYPPGENADTYYPTPNYNRYSVVSLSSDQAKIISDSAEDGIVEFKLNCAYVDGCHETIAHIQIVRNNEIIYDGYPVGGILRINPCSGQIFE